MRCAAQVSFGNGVVARRFRHDSYEALDMPGCQHHLFAYRLSGTTRAERKLDGAWQKAITRRGSVTIVSALQGSSWRLQGSGEIMHFYLPPALLQRIGEEDLEISPRAPIVEHLGAFDPRLSSLVESFAWELEHGVAGFTLYAEAVTTQIAVCLMRHHSKAKQMGRGSASLRRKVEQALVDFVDANLQRDIGLTELAGLADLGLAQFSKRFRATFNVSPYQYVLRRRVERAKMLLQESELSLAQIAVTVGFAHQAHFTTTFKRICGSTPASYRAEIRS